MIRHAVIRSMAADRAAELEPLLDELRALPGLIEEIRGRAAGGPGRASAPLWP